MSGVNKDKKKRLKKQLFRLPLSQLWLDMSLFFDQTQRRYKLKVLKAQREGEITAVISGRREKQGIFLLFLHYRFKMQDCIYYCSF